MTKTCKIRWEMLLSALFVASSTLSAAPVFATSGTMYVTGTTTLTEDHYGTIILAANNARIDCNGHTIYDSTQPGYCGASRTESCGIAAAHIDRGYVINCGVQNFEIGIDGWVVSNLTIRNSGIYVNGDGLHIYNSSSTSNFFVLNNEIALNSDEGIDMEYGYGMRVLNNAVYWNFRDGADVEFGSGNVFSGNLFWDNLLNGLEFDDSPYPSVTNNWFEANGRNPNEPTELRNGLSFDNADNFYVSGNTSVSNSRDGIRVTNGSNNGTVTGNSASGNGEHDAHQIGSSGNTWTSNSFGTTSGI